MLFGKRNPSQKSLDRKINSIIKDKGARINKSIAKELIAYIKDNNLHFEYPADLIKHMETSYDKYTEDSMMEIYLRYRKDQINANEELLKAKKLDAKKVKIRTSQDAQVCSTCKKHSNKTYDINSAPLLPLCWECRCYYEPIIK